MSHFPNSSFVQGISVFEDYGFDVHYRDKDCDIIYVSPAHMTKWGDIMPVSRRLELVRHAADHGSIILEDDFENEFVLPSKTHSFPSESLRWSWRRLYRIFFASSAAFYPNQFYGTSP